MVTSGTGDPLLGGGPPRSFLRRRWKRILAIGIPVCFLLFAFWLYLGYRSFSDEIAHANKRLNKATYRSDTW